MHFRRLARTGGLVALAVLAVLALAAALPLALLSRQLGTTLPAVVFGLPSAAVGVLVARRQPRNPLGSAAVAMAADLSAHPVRADSGGGLAVIDHPVGWFAAVVRVVVPGMLALAGAFVGRQVLSWRHASGERRQQLKWLASGAAVAIVSAVVAAPLAAASPRLGWLHSLLWCGLAALPASMGVAILRYCAVWRTGWAYLG